MSCLITRCFRQFKVTNSKANHNALNNVLSYYQVFPIVQSYKFKSKSQLTSEYGPTTLRVFPIVQSYKFKSKSQRLMNTELLGVRCFRQFKVTNSKANHNLRLNMDPQHLGVSDSSKLQIQKQITTVQFWPVYDRGCFRQFKVTNSKANHNFGAPVSSVDRRCFRQFKVTNSKANHNRRRWYACRRKGVSDSSKLQIQKQITTRLVSQSYCLEVFPIVQSYKFKSKSQRCCVCSRAEPGVSDSSKLQIQKQIAQK